MSDILDLLSDNSTSPKPSGTKKGFLNALKKNSITENNNNIDKPTYLFDKASDDKSSDYQPDNYFGGFSNKNKEEDAMFANTGNEFFKQASNFNERDSKSRTSTGFFHEKPMETSNVTETFGFNRRRTQNFSNASSVDNYPPKNSIDSNDMNKSPDNRNRLNRRISSAIGTIGAIKESEKDGEDETDNTFVPSISNNSRRARGTSVAINIKEPSFLRENSPPSNSILFGFENMPSSKISNDDDITGISFKKEKENSTRSEKVDEAPKTLLKSFKNSPTNQDKRENLNNINRYSEKETTNQEIPMKNESNNVLINNDKVNKNFGKQETTMSFGGGLYGNYDQGDSNKNNNNSNNSNANINIIGDNSDYYKLKLEKDYLESQISIMKQKFDDEKSRYDDLLNDEREKLKKKEQDNYKYIEELRQKHKEEILTLEEKYRHTTQSLYEENKKIRIEIDREIQSERERMNILHKSDLENQENVFKKNLEQQKKFFEDQNDTLKKQLQQQIEFNKLANKVESSSKQIDDILSKFYVEKENAAEYEKISLESKEKYLTEMEEKLRETEKNLASEKDGIIKMRKDFELRELEKKKEHQEEKIRIEKEILRLQELQNSLKIMEFNAKEKYEREKLEMIQKQAEMKIDVDSIKSEYNQRLNELEYQQKIFNEEKKFFEKSKEESIKNIDIKKSDLENKKKLVIEEEKERRERIKILEEKEFYLREQFEDFEKQRNFIEEGKRKNEKDRQDCMIAFNRIKESIKTLDEKERKLEKEKEEIIKRFADFENEKAYVNSEKIKLEQAKSELRLRMQSIEALRMKYVTSTISQPGTIPIGQQFIPNNLEMKTFTDIPLNIIPNTTTSNFYNAKTTTNFHHNINLMGKTHEELRVSKSLSNTSMKKSFNAEEYMYNLKLKLGSGDYNPKNMEYDNNTNLAQFIQKEKEYIKSQNSKSQLNNFAKNEIDTIQNHLKSISNPNMSLNIYETISANYNKENSTQNNFFQNSQAHSNNLNSNINSASNLYNFPNLGYMTKNEDMDENNLKYLNDQKSEFKSFSKDPMEIVEKKEDKTSLFNINYNKTTNFEKNMPASPNLFSSSQLNNNDMNFIKNKINPSGNNLTSFNSIGKQQADLNKTKKKNMFDEIEEMGDIDDLLPTNKNAVNAKNDDDFDV